MREQALFSTSFQFTAELLEIDGHSSIVAESSSNRGIKGLDLLLGDDRHDCSSWSCCGRGELLSTFRESPSSCLRIGPYRFSRGLSFRAAMPDSATAMKSLTDERI
jgi:hypothetical protein